MTITEAPGLNKYLPSCQPRPHNHVGYARPFLSHVGTSYKWSYWLPNFKRCPHKWQCPVSSPVACLAWNLLIFGNLVVLLAEGPAKKLFSCSVMEWTASVFSVHYITLPEMPQAVSGPVSGCRKTFLASWSIVLLPLIPLYPGTHGKYNFVAFSQCH
jgi:hypothetical protein